MPAVVILVVAVLLGGPFVADAQPAGRHRVGVLVSQSWDERAFRQALTSLGYREDANLILDVRSAEGRLARLPSLASELVAASPHVIVAMNSPGVRAAMAATKAIPIVMAEVGDPVATGFVSDLARPEGNVTGAALWLCGQQAVLEQHALNLASKHRLPVMPCRGEAVPAGGLMSYAPDRSESMRRVASYVDRILKGARPAELSVEQPTKIELFVNLKTAGALALTIPPSLLLRADIVIR